MRVRMTYICTVVVAIQDRKSTDMNRTGPTPQAARPKKHRPFQMVEIRRSSYELLKAKARERGMMLYALVEEVVDAGIKVKRLTPEEPVVVPDEAAA